MSERRLSFLTHLAIAVIILPLLAFGSFLPSDASAQNQTCAKFGAVEAFRAPDSARNARLGWERIIFSWSGIQPGGPGDWNYHYFPDSLLDQSRRDGREVVGLLIGTPAWASDGGRGIDVPRGLDLPIDDPNNLWATYVKRIVSKYRGRVNTWVIWNEPDIWDASHSGYQFAGTVEDYYKLLKVAYQVAKSVNPDSKITLAGLTYWWDKQYKREQYLERLLKVASADPTARPNNFYFDIVVLQLYNDPLGLYEIPNETRGMLARYGLSKPIWINETNVAPWDDPTSPNSRDHFRATLDEQASYIIQAAAAALAGNVDRIGFFKMKDDPNLPTGVEHFGLLRSDDSPRPAYDALKVVTRYLDGARNITLTKKGTVVQIAFDRDGEKVTVLWNTSPKPVEARVTARSSLAWLVDKVGLESGIGLSGGEYRVLLPGATHNTAPRDPGRYLIGGGPFLLVESASAPLPAPAQETIQPGALFPGEDSKIAWTAPTSVVVSGEWLAFLKLAGDVDNQGYPRAQVTKDETTGQIVQCFQRSVFEYHPELAGPPRIQRRLLGDILYPGADAPVAPTDAPPGPSAYFPFSPDRPTGLGHFVADSTRDGKPTYFKQYFDSHGGVLAFGYPKEEPKLKDGRWTQRFQAAVFEYHPENDRDGVIEETNIPARHYRVQLELLGDKYAAQLPACNAK